VNSSGPEKQKGVSPILSYDIIHLRISSSFRCRCYKSKYSPSVTGLRTEQQSHTGVRSLAKKAKLLSFNRAQSRVVPGLLTIHKTLRKHLYVMGLSNNPTCRKCGTEEEISVHILCECEALASLRHAHLGSFFLDHEDIMNLRIGSIWNFGKGTGLL
jgi:predicted Zn-ribbon and HTH transcriptional regulator